MPVLSPKVQRRMTQRITYVPNNMATSADEEKVLLLHNTTELRRLIKQGPLRYWGNKKEYYEQAFVQESKMNQQLQEYMSYLESKVQQKNDRRSLVTEMFEADALTEQMKVENENLCKKEEQMRQEMALLQEQLKIFEDDFSKDCFDKQVFQWLLSKSRGKNVIPGAWAGNSKEKLYASAIATSARSRPGSKHCRKGIKYSRKREPETFRKLEWASPPGSSATCPSHFPES